MNNGVAHLEGEEPAPVLRRRRDGRERHYRRIDARIARLAVHSASTAAFFILEARQHKYPSRDLSIT